MYLIKRNNRVIGENCLLNESIIYRRFRVNNTLFCCLTLTYIHNFSVNIFYLHKSDLLIPNKWKSYKIELKNSLACILHMQFKWFFKTSKKKLKQIIKWPKFNQNHFIPTWDSTNYKTFESVFRVFRCKKKILNNSIPIETIAIPYVKNCSILFVCITK